MSYEFHKGETDGNIAVYAEYNHDSDVQHYYLETISALVTRDDLMDVADILREFITQLFIHEDLHQAIENVDMDTIGESQHETIYPIICKWNKTGDD